MTDSGLCRFPHNKGKTGYNKGCRCPRCKADTAVVRKRYNTKNTEQYRKYNREYRNKNREMLAQKKRDVIPRAKNILVKRAKKSGVPVPVCPVQYTELLKVYIQAQILIRDGVPCHVDHVIPLEHGGTHTADNVRLLDPHTNMARRWNPDTPCTPLVLTPEQLDEYKKLVKKIVLRPRLRKI
jgi:hypothetical protein